MNASNKCLFKIANKKQTGAYKSINLNFLSSADLKIFSNNVFNKNEFNYLRPNAMFKNSMISIFRFYK